MFRHILKAEGRWDADKAQYYPNKRIYKIKGRCPFLDCYEDGTTGCQIYSFRPMICKIFPVSGECPSMHQDNLNMEKSNE